jgi:hypothetical protein
MTAQRFVLRGMTTGVAPVGRVVAIDKATGAAAVRPSAPDGRVAALPSVLTDSTTTVVLADLDIEARAASVNKRACEPSATVAPAHP